MKRIPWARFIEEGNEPGQVPTLSFGHNWYEYFDAKVWQDVVDNFMKDMARQPQFNQPVCNTF